MSQRRKKKEHAHPEEFDLLPFANFFLLVVPFLLALAVWQKYAVIEIKLSEAAVPSPDSAPPKGEDIDPNLTVFIASDSMEVHVNGGGEWEGVAFPKIYFKEMVSFQCPTDVGPRTIPMNQFRVWQDTGYQVIAKCDNGNLSRQGDIQDIQLIALDRKSKDDPGTEMSCVRESNTNQCIIAGVDSINTPTHKATQFDLVATDLKQIQGGQTYSIAGVGDLALGDSSKRFEINILAHGQQRTSIPQVGDSATILKAKVRQVHERELNELAVDKMSAYDVLATQLMYVRSKLSIDPNCDWGPGILKDFGTAMRNETCTYDHKVYITPDKRVPYDRVAKVMDMVRNIGFDQVEFGVLQQ